MRISPGEVAISSGETFSILHSPEAISGYTVTDADTIR